MQNKTLCVLKTLWGASWPTWLHQHGSQYPELQAQEQHALLTPAPSAQTTRPSPTIPMPNLPPWKLSPVQQTTTQAEPKQEGSF